MPDPSHQTTVAGWRPETDAPSGARVIIEVRLTSTMEVAIGYKDRDDGEWRYDGSEALLVEGEVTGWQPLPEARNAR